MKESLNLIEYYITMKVCARFYNIFIPWLRSVRSVKTWHPLINLMSALLSSVRLEGSAEKQQGDV